MTYKKKLIEVALPLDAINREAAREKTIRHGHPSTLHLWWARRPLAACRAVLFAQLVDDPSAHPDQFPTEDAQEAERLRLFGIIEELVKWENVSNERVLAVARDEIRRSCGGSPPPILDPFAGGGSVPLEAQRLGLEAHASDLNPVPVLINKALVEIPPRWSDRAPTHPDGGQTLGNRTWTGMQGLVEDVRHYGQWMLDEARNRIGALYPPVKLNDGSTAPAIAWIWARTVACPNPTCGAELPLVRSFWLGKKRGKEAWIRPVVNGTRVTYDISHSKEGPSEDGTVNRTGATCVVCRSGVSLKYVRDEGQAGRMGNRLMAIVAEGHRQRIYVAPSTEHETVANVSRPDDVPDTQIPFNPRYLTTPNYGMSHHADLFTNRQLSALCTLSDLVSEARDRVEADSLRSGLPETEAKQYADDIATYLGFFVSKQADLGSNLCRWKVDAECPVGVFGRQAIPMLWDFAEGNPLGSSAGSFEVILRNQLRTLSSPSVDFLRTVPGTASQSNARSADVAGKVVCTDPPYYDNIGYADLADFFYVWLRRSLRTVYPETLGTMLTPKEEELIANPFRFEGDKSLSRDHFERGFIQTFSHLHEGHAPDFPMTVFYAFKQAEDEGGDRASTGWQTLLEGLLTAGMAITATWPVRTEATGRMRNYASNALASSIVLVCRARTNAAGVTDRGGFLAALRAELPQELKLLQQAAIAPVDLAQASIGPGMGVFSRYAKVIEPSGEPMRVRTALELINQVLAEVLDAADGELDADTRWAVKWFEQRGLDEGPFGEAEVLATATGVSVEGLVRSGIVSSRAGRVRLLERSELPEDWDPVSDDRISVWEATQHLVKALEEGGESAAAELLGQLGGIGDSAQQLAYRLYSTCERKGWAKEAGPYNALAAVWGSLRTFASVEVVAEQGTLL